MSQIENEKNLRWICLEQCMLPELKIRRNDIFEQFLQRTLQPDYSKIFLQIFKSIDTYGYLNKSFYDQKAIVNGSSMLIGKIKKITALFSPFWKSQISINGSKKTVLCLHDE